MCGRISASKPEASGTWEQCFLVIAGLTGQDEEQTQEEALLLFICSFVSGGRERE
jgi:hypothetical protein